VRTIESKTAADSSTGKEIARSEGISCADSKPVVPSIRDVSAAVADDWSSQDGRAFVGASASESAVADTAKPHDRSDADGRNSVETDQPPLSNTVADDNGGTEAANRDWGKAKPDWGKTKETKPPERGIVDAMKASGVARRAVFKSRVERVHPGVNGTTADARTLVTRRDAEAVQRSEGVAVAVGLRVNVPVGANGLESSKNQVRSRAGHGGAFSSRAGSAMV
jgi:hypothetical protein